MPASRIIAEFPRSGGISLKPQAAIYPWGKEMGIAEDLKSLISEEQVASNPLTLYAYSTDASLYEVMPQVVVYVEREEDIQRVMSYAFDKGIPVTPRCSGSSISGGAIGKGIILDFCNYNSVEEVNPEEKWVRIRPGVIYADLNRILERFDLMFPPDPASGDFNRLGGMMGHNASGPRSVMYGFTKDYVLELEVFLPDGRKLIAKNYDVEDTEFNRLLSDYQEVKMLYDLVKNNVKTILSNRPLVHKNTSGYNLFDIAEGLMEGKFYLPKVFVGADGTLGVISKARLGLVDLPKQNVTALLYFDMIEEAASAVVEILKVEPTAVEILEWNSMDLIGREEYGIPKNAEAMILVEFTEGDLEEKLSQTEEICRKYSLSTEPRRAYDEEEQKEVWKVRKAIVPILYKYDPKKKPIPFVEDAVVPTESVPQFVRYATSLFRRYSLQAGIYGHIGDGNTHMRPLVDANDPSDFDVMRKILPKIYGKAIELRGSITGEHGDGRLRPEYVPKLYGEELYGLFKQVKGVFDPKGIMNPDVKISDRKWTEEIDFHKIAFECATCAKCNPLCPSFDIWQREDYGPRGWYRIAKSHDLDYGKAKAYFDFCLNCKMCRVVCPAGADPSEEVLRVRSFSPSSIEEVTGKKLSEDFGEALVLSLGKRYALPSRDSGLSDLFSGTDEIAYFSGCFERELKTGISEDMAVIFRNASVEVSYPDQVCCGAPDITYGYPEKAREKARFNIDSFSRYRKIITPCPTCALYLKEYSSLLSGDELYFEKAKQFSEKVITASEFIHSYLLPKLQWKGYGWRTVFHAPFHEIALSTSEISLEILRNLLGIEFEELDEPARCCGAVLGFNLHKPDFSGKMLKKCVESLELPKVENVVTSSVYCLYYLKEGTKTDVSVEHLVSVVRRALDALE